MSYALERLRYHVSGAIARGEATAIAGIDATEREAMRARAAALASNPHNVGVMRLNNHAYWSAVYEREGREAPQGAANPYAPGTMAATRWIAGRTVAL